MATAEDVRRLLKLHPDLIPLQPYEKAILNAFLQRTREETMERLNEFRKTIPDHWPASCPNVKKDYHGWFAGRPIGLIRAMPPNPKVIVELGSWLGKSTLWFLKTYPKATVICIDHWKGDPSNWSQPKAKARLPYLFDTFVANMWEYRDRIIILKEGTLTGMIRVANAGIDPDFVYIDAAHDLESVRKDTEMALSYFSRSAVVAGDDWGDFEVSEGVMAALKKTPPLEHGKLRTWGKVWWIEKNNL